MQMEKRTYHRNSQKIPLVCRPFTTKYTDDIFSGSMLNFCENGMYVESKAYLKEKVTLLVRVNTGATNGFRAGETVGLRTLSLAEVKWTKSFQDALGSPLYGYGLRYLE